MKIALVVNETTYEVDAIYRDQPQTIQLEKQGELMTELVGQFDQAGVLPVRIHTGETLEEALAQPAQETFESVIYFMDHRRYDVGGLYHTINLRVVK